MKKEFIEVGTVVNTHGVRGELKLHPDGVDPLYLMSFKRLFIDGKETAVKAARVHKNMLLLTLAGIEDMDAALALKGRRVSVARADAALPAGEYFDAELEGCTVLDAADGSELGTLCRVLDYPAHKVYEVRGEREYLIPAVKEVFIDSVDIDAGIIRVKRMKGLAVDEN